MAFRNIAFGSRSNYTQVNWRARSNCWDRYGTQGCLKSLEIELSYRIPISSHLLLDSAGQFDVPYQYKTSDASGDMLDSVRRRAGSFCFGQESHQVRSCHGRSIETFVQNCAHAPCKNANERWTIDYGSVTSGMHLQRSRPVGKKEESPGLARNA